MNLPRHVVHSVFFKQREDCKINRYDGRRQGHHGVRFAVLFRLLVGVVDDVPNDAIDAKRWFDDVGQVPLPGFLDGLSICLHVFRLNHDDVATGQREVARKGG